VTVFLGQGSFGIWDFGQGCCDNFSIGYYVRIIRRNMKIVIWAKGFLKDKPLYGGLGPFARFHASGLLSLQLSFSILFSSMKKPYG
jgi:hypothetical protein